MVSFNIAANYYFPYTRKDWPIFFAILGKKIFHSTQLAAKNVKQTYNKRFYVRNSFRYAFARSAPFVHLLRITASISTCQQNFPSQRRNLQLPPICVSWHHIWSDRALHVDFVGWKLWSQQRRAISCGFFCTWKKNKKCAPVVFEVCFRSSQHKLPHSNRYRSRGRVCEFSQRQWKDQKEPVLLCQPLDF